MKSRIGSLLCIVFILLFTLPSSALALRGDTNCDSSINFDDIDPFIKALAGQAVYQAAYPNCVWLNADINNSGNVNFDDIDPFIALLSSCGSNQPPLANAGPDQSGEPGETLTFNGSGSSDPDGTSGNLSYNWQFGDTTSAQGVIVSHSYSQPGTYTVSLRVQDPCGAVSSDSISVQVLAAGLTANFIIEEQKRSPSGTLYWQEIDPDSIVEQGLKLRFNASGSYGAAYYAFEYGDFGGNPDVTSPYDRHGFTAPVDYPLNNQTYTVRLTVWDASGDQSATASKTVRVSSGFTEYGNVNVCVGGLIARMIRHGQELWLSCSDGSIKVVSISDPSFPEPPVTFLSDLYGIPPWSVVDYNGSQYVILSNGTLDVHVYERVTQNSLVHLGQFRVPEQVSWGTSGIISANNHVFIGTGASGQLYEYSLNSIIQSPSAALPVRSYSLPGGSAAFAVKGSRVFVAGRSSSSVTVFDCQQAASAPAVYSINLPGPYPLVYGLYAAPEYLLVQNGPLLVFVDYSSLSIIGQTAWEGSVYIAAGNGRCYRVGGPPFVRVYKYDCTDPNNVYNMEIRPSYGSYMGDIIEASVILDGQERSMVFWLAVGPLSSMRTWGAQWW